MLKGGIAVITGSSSGIGAGVAVAFARHGAGGIVINYPTESEAGQAGAVVAAVEAEGGAAIAVQADVAAEDGATALVAAAEDRFGRIDILVNNAGIAHTAPVEAMPVDIWDRVLAVHLRSTFLMTRLVLPGMYARDAGRIINTASQLAYKGAPGLSAYTAAKGAMLSFTRSLALEIGTRGVRANCVAPGATRTAILDSVDAEVLEAVRAAIPTGRIAEVADIVPAYVFLASDGGRHFQGQCLSPNGGDQFL
ncbi:SDR family NAD(P)-dependent oxidoreductase [Polymorphobacter sp.]|uniref:SDR family NAD(P)-dependent oxidoreductase n=1 Tax=Polymorphobacter sp. TaxID=1909290 RepID=UPI003F6F21C8